LAPSIGTRLKQCSWGMLLDPNYTPSPGTDQSRTAWSLRPGGAPLCVAKISKMEDDLNEGDFTVEETIELELHGAQVVIDALGEGEVPELFVQIRDDLRLLLGQVKRGEVPPERACAQLNTITESRDQWLRDNPIPPD
jgi:hypothetical protein